MRGRWAAAASAALLVALVGCTPSSDDGADDAVQQVSIVGRISEVASASGSRTSYVIRVGEEGLLSLTASERPPFAASAVVVEVPASLEIPDDPAGMFAALDAYIDETGEPLVVVGYE